MAFSPDGRQALSGSWDNTLKLWEIASGRLVRTFEGHTEAVNSVAFSPDGRQALSGSIDNTLKLWETASGRLMRTFKGHTDKVFSVAFSPDGRQVLSGSRDNTLKLRDISPWTMPEEAPLAQATPRPVPKRKPKAKSDRTPPTIRITAPAITRGMKKVQQDKTVLVKGRATDKSGIFEVLVNGVEAQVEADGSFWSEVKLAFGENRIVVEATDTKDNAASTAFTVVRETGAKAPLVVAARAEEPEMDFGEYYALFIAVEDYPSRDIDNLDYPVKDAESFRNVLLEKYSFEQENVTFLKNPTRKEIFSEFRSLKKLGENDNLLIFYAGHGHWDEDARQGYWLPSDASEDDDNWISNSDIKDRIRSISSRHTLLISDACFSGGIFKSRSAFSDASVSVQKTYEMKSRAAMTSGNLKEVPDQSVFVEYLVKRLKGNREQYLYSQKLYVSLKDAVTDNSANSQTPLFGVIQGAGHDGGDFIFVRKR